MDYEKIYNEFNLNNQYWFAELKNGYVISLGFGLVENEDWLTTFDIISKLNLEGELTYQENYYILDGATCATSKKGKKTLLEDLGYDYHPNEDSFVLLPKNEVVKVWFEIREKRKPTKIRANKL